MRAGRQRWGMARETGGKMSKTGDIFHKNCDTRSGGRREKTVWKTGKYGYLFLDRKVMGVVR